MTTSPTATMNAVAVATPAWASDVYGKLEVARPVAEFLSKSDLIPKGFQGAPNNILIAGAMGARLGLDLFSSLAGIAVVNGRATLWGDALLAVCQQHPQFEDYAQEVTGEGDTQQATVTVKRKGRSPHTETFSVADAKKASLWGKQGPWSQYPKRMLALRARAFALRTVFADALAGFHAKEEMDDEPREVEATVHADPRPAKRRTVESARDLPDGTTIHQGAETTITKQTLPTNTEQSPAVEAKPEDVKTVGDHVAESQAKPKDISPDACVAEFSALWKHSDAGKARAKAIQHTWNLKQIADLGGASDGDREAFLAEVAEGMALVKG